jgi:hypothetical protein
LLTANAEGLTIDRIYQEGEVLERPRNLIQEYPSAKPGCDPFVRTVKIDAVTARTAVGLHGMAPLAERMVDLSYEHDKRRDYYTPPSPACKIKLRYAPPGTDVDGTVVAGVGVRIASARARRALYASPADRFGEYQDRFSSSFPFGVQQSDPATELKGVKIHRVAIVSGGRRSKKLRVANSL